MSLPANFPVVSTAPLPLSGDHLQSLSPAERKKALAQQANWSAEKRPGESHVIRHRAVPFDKPLLERPDPLAVNCMSLFGLGAD